MYISFLTVLQEHVLLNSNILDARPKKQLFQIRELITKKENCFLILKLTYLLLITYTLQIPKDIFSTLTHNIRWSFSLLRKEWN